MGVRKRVSGRACRRRHKGRAPFVPGPAHTVVAEGEDDEEAGEHQVPEAQNAVPAAPVLEARHAQHHGHRLPLLPHALAGGVVRGWGQRGEAREVGGDSSSGGGDALMEGPPAVATVTMTDSPNTRGERKTMKMS